MRTTHFAARLSALLVAALAATSAASAGIDTWTTHGPEGGAVREKEWGQP